MSLSPYIDFEHWVANVLTELQRSVAQGFDRLENKIMATAEEYVTRLDAATTEVASDLRSVRDELAALRDSLEAAQQAAVDAALAKLDAPIARLEQLGSDPENPVPDQPA